MTENYSGRTTFGDIDFNPDQIEEYKMVFTEFDIDGDGTITVQVSPFSAPPLGFTRLRK